MYNTYETLPDNLPVPIDDGACDHLLGMHLPDLNLQSTDDREINLSQGTGKVVIYCYPMTGQPGVPLPDGWDKIPGARGCTPQSLAFKDHYSQMVKLGATLYGLSTQTLSYQQEMARRLELPFEVLSDHALNFSDAMRLPTFTVEGMTLLKRVTMIVDRGLIEAIHYPVFPTDTDPQWVIQFLGANSDS